MTLLESLVVVALTVLLGALAFPSLERSSRLLRYEQARVRLTADLAEARARAITGNRATTLQPGGDGRAYSNADGAAVALPGGLRLMAPDDAPRFLPDGSAEGGPLLLVASGWRAGIALDPVTGLVDPARR